MKKLLLLSLIILGCSKPKTDSPKPDVVAKGSASYMAGANTYFWNESGSNFKIDSSDGVTSCRLGKLVSDSGKFSGNIYTFEFDDTVRNTSLRFAIPANDYPSFKFPINTPLSFNYDNNYWSSLPTLCVLIFSFNEVVQGNRGSVAITITKVTDKTIDGSFSATIQFFSTLSTTPVQTALISNGVFHNVPIKNDL